MTAFVKDIQSLPMHERLQIVEDIWDDIALGTQMLEVPQWQKEELDLRDAEFRENPGSGISWQNARDIIRGHGS